MPRNIKGIGLFILIRDRRCRGIFISKRRMERNMDSLVDVQDVIVGSGDCPGNYIHRNVERGSRDE